VALLHYRYQRTVLLRNAENASMENFGIEIDDTSGTEGKTRYKIGRYKWSGWIIPVRKIPVHMVGSEHACMEKGSIENVGTENVEMQNAGNRYLSINSPTVLIDS
jgi:hypothetical protein